MSEKQSKETKSTEVKTLEKENKDMKNVFVRGIMGTSLLLVFGSIAFLAVVVWTGTDNPSYKLLAAPAIIFDLVIAFVAFSKILK